MAMLVGRYNVVRERLIQLYQILEFQSFQVWVAPEFLMTTEELRTRETHWKEGFANDSTFYETPTLRSMKVTQMLRILPNLRSYRDLGFKNPNKNIVLLYESLQEYLSLWVETILEQRWLYPSLTELNALQNLAYLIFTPYKQIKPYLRDQELNERFKNDQALNAKGLAGFAALFGMYSIGTQGSAEISFVSHLEQLGQLNDGFAQLPNINMGGDSMARIESSGGNPNWLL